MHLPVEILDDRKYVETKIHDKFVQEYVRSVIETNEGKLEVVWPRKHVTYFPTNSTDEFDMRTVSKEVCIVVMVAEDGHETRLTLDLDESVESAGADNGFQL